MFSCTFRLCLDTYGVKDLWRCHCFVVYDKMGYMGTVTRTAEDSLLEQISEALNTDSYHENNRAVNLVVTSTFSLLQ